MAVWGACWGVVLGLLWVLLDAGGDSWEFVLLLGGVLGALLAASLRRVLRREWQLWQQEAQSLPRALGTEAAAVASITPISAALAPEVPSTRCATAEAELKAEDIAPAATAPMRPRRRLLATTATASSAEVANRPAPSRALANSNPAWWLAMQNWLSGGNVVVRLGVFLLFIGLAFLAKYAVQAGLFPPPLRIASIALVGVLLLLAGWKNTSASNARRQQYALTLQGAGVAVLYLSVYAALRLYALLPAGAAFALFAAVAGLGAALALKQGSQALAFIGFAGGFAAPLLASTGGGQFVLLFSYYLLLNIVLVGLAYARAWRGLNLLGFGFSFAVLGAWVAWSYLPAHYSQIQPFVLAYFALYVLAALFYALRHSLAPRQALDATLLFGVPTATMGIQTQLLQGMPQGAAWFSVVMAVFYALLSFGMQAQAVRGAAGAADAASAPRVIARWLAESYLALALVFFTLAVPLALDAPWTAAVWALEGAAVYWVGQRQGHWFPRLMGLALQPLALYVFWDADISSATSAVLHPRLPGLLLLAFAAGLLCYWVHLRQRYAAARQESLAALTGWSRNMGAWVDGLERWVAAPLFALGLWSWVEAGYQQIYRNIASPEALGGTHAWIARDSQAHCFLLFFALTAFALHFAARSEWRQPLGMAAWPTAALLPILLLFAGVEVFSRGGFWQDGGWWAWPLALAAYAYALRGVDGSLQGKTSALWAWVHVLSWALPWLLLQDALDAGVRHLGWQRSAWDEITWLLSSTLVLAYGSRAAHWAAAQAQTGPAGPWPWQAYGVALMRFGQSLWALLVALLGLQVAISSSADSTPLNYWPLLNPTDAALLLAAWVLWRWQRQQSLAESRLRLWPLSMVRWALALWGFAVLNSIWLRLVHHGWDLPWGSDALYRSFITQAGYSILWTLLALGMMLLAARRSQRSLWLAGAGLLGLTVLKLLLVDLSNSGGAERIISFIAVGGLMLVLGYFVPLPPKQPDASEVSKQ